MGILSCMDTPAVSEPDRSAQGKRESHVLQWNPESEDTMGLAEITPEERARLFSCFQCGTCTGGCPIARKSKLNIRRLVSRFVLRKDLDRLKEQLTAFEEMNMTTTTELKTIRTAISQMNETIAKKMEQKGRAESFVMHLGTMEIPIELTGVIGGCLAFTIAIIVLIGQKEILLSPVFLCGVGVLLIGVALSKMIRARSRRTLHPFMTMPTDASSVPIETEISEE